MYNTLGQNITFNNVNFVNIMILTVLMLLNVVKFKCLLAVEVILIKIFNQYLIINPVFRKEL